MKNFSILLIIFLFAIFTILCTANNEMTNEDNSSTNNNNSNNVSNNDGEEEDKYFAEYVLVDHGDPMEYPSDPFEVITAKMVGIHTLKMIVEYGGGCEEHSFIYYWDGTMYETEPVQIEVLLTHDGQNDACEMLVTDDIYIDFSVFSQEMNITIYTNHGYSEEFYYNPEE